MSGEITQVATTITIPPFTVIQNGLIYTKDILTSKASPEMRAPYYLAVSSPTATNTDNLIFTFAQRPDDITSDYVLIGTYDGDGWRIPELVSIEGIIDERRLQNIVAGNTGAYNGLKTTVVSGNYVTSPGDLIDKRGERQSFVTALTNPVIEGDADWQRVDRMLFRRPEDWPHRVGTIKFVLGGTYAKIPAHLHDKTLFTGSNTAYSRIVTASDNTAFVFCTVGGSGSYTLKCSKLASDKSSPPILSDVAIIAGLTDPRFDVVIDMNDLIHVVYADTGDIKYQRINSDISLEGTSFTVDAQSASCNPRCKLDPNHISLYIIYEAMDGIYSQLYATSRNVEDGGQALSVRKITEYPGTSASNKINPDLAFDNDFNLHLVWENSTATTIEYQRYDSYLVALDSSPSIVSALTTHGVGTLINGANKPRIQVSDDMEPFIAFRQNASGSYGVAIWTQSGAYMVDMFSTGGNNILAFEFFIDPIFNGPAIITSRATSVDYVKLLNNYATASVPVDFTLNLMSATSPAVALERDRLGAMLVAWQDAALGGRFSKVPAEGFAKAFSREELSGDVLLTRMVQPDGVILNWIPNGRPGSFYDFLLAHGQGVLMDWEVTAPNHFTLGAGLSLFDMYSGMDYSIAAGSYDITEDEVLYIQLDGVTSTVVPQVCHSTLVPWDENAVALAVIKEGQFNPAVMGVAGMIQMDSGETIIFGEDLPQSIRARLGIIDETHFQAYASNIAANVSDTYPQAISNLDIMSGQNRHVRLVSLDADWGVSTVGSFKLNSSVYVQIPGLANSRNEIQAVSKALSDGEVAYVSLNRTASGGSGQLTLSVSALSALVLTRNTFIVARRVGDFLVVDSLGAKFPMGTTITSEVSQSKRDAATADVIDLTTNTSLPSGASCTIHGYSLVNGDRVLFAHEDFDAIYQVNGVGSSISWTKIKEFNGSDQASQDDFVHIGTSGNDPDLNITWRYDVYNSGTTRWVPATLSTSNRDYLGLLAGDPSKDGGEYQDQLSSGQLNNVVIEGDRLEKAIKRLDIRQDVVKRVRVITRTHSALPTGSACTIDTEVLVNGNKVLFAHASLNGIYQIAGVGTSITWTKLYEFAGSQTPSASDLVMVYGGTEVYRTIWSYDSVKSWYRITTNDDLVSIRAMDLTTTVLPVAGPVVVDGQTILEGELVLYGNAALNRVYRVSYIGATLFEEMNVFVGNKVPRDGSAVIAQDGSVSDVVWEYDAEVSLWIAITVTTQNKTYLGLTSPSKSGGTYVAQITAGQLNNVVVEGDILEKAIKRLDVREDVLKRVRAIDRVRVTLPTGSSCTIDAEVLVNGDKVLFANTSVPTGSGIYQIAGVGSAITWTKLYEFAGATTPTAKSVVMVYGGGEINRTLWSYDVSKGWYRVSSLVDFVEVRAMDLTTAVLPTGSSLTVDGQVILEGELVLLGNAALNKVYRVTGIGSSIALESLNVFHGLVAPSDGSRILAQDGAVSDVMWEYDAELGAWSAITVTYQNKTYLGLTSPSKSGGTYVDQLSVGQTNNVVVEADILEKAIKRLDVREDILKRVRVIDLTLATLPTAVPTVIDGATIATGNKVLFGALTSNPGIYQATVAGTISWVRLYEFGGSQSPSTTEVVLVREGTARGKTVWQYNTAITPPWHRLAGAPEHIWTGSDFISAPTFDGTLSSADSNLASALLTIDKYFRALQLHEHPTLKQRVIVTSSEAAKTNNTMFRSIINSKVMSFTGAQLDFVTGQIYAGDGVTPIGTFVAPGLAVGQYLWYSIGLGSISASPTTNMISPTIVVDIGADTNASRELAKRPDLTSEFVIGNVAICGSNTSPFIDDILPGSLVQISGVNNAGVFQRIDDLEAAYVLHTTEINELQNAIASILANEPKMEVFTAGVGGQKIFDLTLFSMEYDVGTIDFPKNPNSRIDVECNIQGRWQTPSVIGDFTDGSVRKNSSTQLEFAEFIAAGETIVVIKRDAAAIFANAIKVQNFTAGVGGQTLFTLDPLIFQVNPDNTAFDADYFIDGRWQMPSNSNDILNPFSTGSAVRKNSTTDIEFAESITQGKTVTVYMRTPNGAATGGGGGGGGSTDLTDITVDLGFATPRTVGTLAKPAKSMILKDTVTTDIWELKVVSGEVVAVKIN